ncbi:MAG: hypothetical protein ACLFPQ_00315 [Candidatus Woesearchaeota archaeon]
MAFRKYLFFAVVSFIIALSVFDTSHAGGLREIHKGSLYPGEVVTKNGMSFYISHVESSEKAHITFMLQNENRSYFIDRNETYADDYFNMIYLFRIFDLDRGIGKLENGTLKEIPGYIFIINTKIPYLEISQKASVKKAGLKDNVNIRITIKNSGSPTQIKFSQAIEDGIVAVPIRNLSIKNNNLVYEGKMDDEIVLEYSIRSKKSRLLEISPDISFDYLGIEETVETDPLLIDFSHGIESHGSLNASSSRLGEFMDYLYIVKNTKNESHDFKASINFPKGYDVFYIGTNKSSGEDQNKLSKIGKLDKYDGSFSFSHDYSLSPYEEFYYYFTVQSKNVSYGIRQNISSSMKISVDGIISESKDTDDTVLLYTMPWIEVWSNSSKINESDSVNLVVLLKNKNQDKFIKDLYFFIDGNFIESMEYYKPVLELENEEIVFNLAYEPEYIGNEDAFVNVTAIYKTRFDETINLKEYVVITKKNVKDTSEFLENTELEEIFPYVEPKKNLIGHIENFVNGFISNVQGKKYAPKDNLFIVPLVIVVLIITISMMKSWGIDLTSRDLYSNLFKRFKK